MTHAIVHIGFNKCGSTAIQKWLSDQASSLGEFGFAYKRTDPRDEMVCSNPQFLDLAFSRAGQVLPGRNMTKVLGYTAGDLDGQNRVSEGFLADYAAWVAECDADTVLISNEFLAPRLSEPELVKALDSALHEMFETVRYVAYIRGAMPWHISRFGHEQRRRKAEMDLDDFVGLKPRVPFEKRLRTWLDVVSRERLDVRLFQENWLSTNGLFRDYCTAVGLDADAMDVRSRRVNISFDAANPNQADPAALPQTDDTVRAANENNDAAKAESAAEPASEKPTDAAAQTTPEAQTGAAAETPADPPKKARKRPPRPVPSDALLDRVAAMNEPAMTWIGDTFFNQDPSQFRDWLEFNTLSQRQKA